MRKNTLIKLLAVLAMCFLIGAALVSCGEGEAENADVKTIVSINFSGDKLVVAYNDGTTASVDLPKAEACNHENAIVLVFEEHTANSDGEYLYVCNECGASEVKYEKNHKFVADNKTVAPTCTEDGYTTTHSCEFCGEPSEETDVVPALKHDHTSGYVLVKGDYCQGGLMVSVCDRCGGDPQEKEIPRADDSDFDGIHTVETWDVVDDKDPTYTEGAKVVGYCTVEGCLNPEVIKDIGALPEKDSNTEYTYDKANSDLYVSCGDAADYLYIHKETGLEFHVVVAAESVIKHELNGKEMTSVDLVAPGKEFENAYYLEDYEGIVTFANHPLSCDKAALAHFTCTAEHDGGVCGKDISVYVKLKHTPGNNKWVNVNSEDKNCVGPVDQTRECDICDLHDTRTNPKQDHSFKYESDVLYTKNGGEYVAGYTFPETANEAADIPTLYYQGVCEYGCNECEYTALTEYGYKFETETAATCQADGKAKITYKKATTGEVVTVDITLPLFAHKTTVAGEKVAIVEGKEDKKVIIYNADHADYKNLVKELDNVAFSENVPVLGYIHCDCACGCIEHDVTVWVQKLGEDGPATKEF